jgi:hypothetical protein
VTSEKVATSAPAKVSAPVKAAEGVATTVSASIAAPPSGRADLAELADARAGARDRPDDRRALKAWATAALRAGALREARRAGETWALRDDGVEPRLFLANVLDATGHRGDAKAVLEQWLEMHPDSNEARRLQAHLSATAPKAERVVHKTTEKAEK